jgi:hypothetical protein
MDGLRVSAMFTVTSLHWLSFTLFIFGMSQTPQSMDFCPSIERECPGKRVVT